METIKIKVKETVEKEVELSLPYFCKGAAYYFCLYGQGDWDAIKVSDKGISETCKNSVLYHGNTEISLEDFLDRYQIAKIAMEKQVLDIIEMSETETINLK